MAKKKSAAYRRRRDFGIYASIVTYNLPFLDLVDTLAYILREQEEDAEPPLDRERIQDLVNDFLSDHGQQGIKHAKSATEDTKLVPNHVYDFVLDQVGASFPELEGGPTTKPPTSAPPPAVKDEVITPYGRSLLKHRQRAPKRAGDQ